MAWSSRPNVSTRMCRFLPLIFLPASYPCGSMHEGHTDAALQGVEVVSPPRAGPAVPWLEEFGSVVAAEDDDRVCILWGDLRQSLGIFERRAGISAVAAECDQRQQA